MAAMVAPGSSQLSPSLPVQDKGHRNKRKFRTDPPLTESNKLVPPQIEYPNYELPSEKSSNDCIVEQHAGVCDLCSSLTCPPGDELDMDEYPDADWTELTETQLEELVLKNLDMIFKSAIVKIQGCGHPEEAAMKSVLRSGICYGSKDTISNIVDNALAYLKNAKDVDSSKEHLFEDLQQLEKYVLAEMVCVLREVRPFFSTGDAMWCLLICDMNVSHACAMDCDPLSGLGSDETACSSSVPWVKSESNSNSSASSSTPEPSAPKPSKANSVPSSSQILPQSEMPPVAGIPSLPYIRPSSLGNAPATQSNPKSGKDALPPSNSVAEEFSSATVLQPYNPEEKPVSAKKGHGGGSKRESVLRQKSVHLEKTYRAYRSKGALRAGKLSSLGSLILDKKCKSSPDSTGIKSASMKKSKSVGLDAFQGDGNLTLAFSAGGPPGSPFIPKPVKNPPPLPTTNTDLSLSLSSKSNTHTSNPKPNCTTDIADYCSYTGLPSNKMGGQWIPQDKKDEMLLNLVPRVRELQAQLHEWTEWGQQKVMQAARRLSKDKAELQTLRQEKEEVTRLKKEKQTLEENTVKKLSEMESALTKASGQVEKANAAAHRLEVENAELRLEMEAAKLRAEESAASCQEVSKREMKTVKNFQSWERQKAVLREELMTEKRKLSQLQEQLEQAKVYRDQLEARWRQEEKMKDEVLMQAGSERKQREQIEASAKLKEDTMALEADSVLQRYKDNIRNLENQISQLRLKIDSSKVASLFRGLDGSYASRLADKKTPHQKDGSNAHCISVMMALQEPGCGDVERERECVMCLTEEMSVVFLPCAHQVVCNTCNELHEKQGMKDCPSCRTLIQRRISVRSADY